MAGAGIQDPELRAFMEQQAGQARLTGVVMGFTDMCWEKCIDKPGSKPIVSV